MKDLWKRLDRADRRRAVLRRLRKFDAYVHQLERLEASRDATALRYRARRITLANAPVAPKDVAMVCALIVLYLIELVLLKPHIDFLVVQAAPDALLVGMDSGLIAAIILTLTYLMPLALQGLELGLGASSSEKSPLQFVMATIVPGLVLAGFLVQQVGYSDLEGLAWLGFAIQGLMVMLLAIVAHAFVCFRGGKALEALARLFWRQDRRRLARRLERLTQRCRSAQQRAQAARIDYESKARPLFKDYPEEEQLLPNLSPVTSDLLIAAAGGAAHAALSAGAASSIDPVTSHLEHEHNGQRHPAAAP